MNVAAPELAAHLDRGWEAYRQGLIAEVAGLVAPGRTLLEASEGLDGRSRGNAEVELGMFAVVATMVTGTRPTDCLEAATELAKQVAPPTAACDGIHRLAGLAASVHAAMRASAFTTAEKGFQQALAVARSLDEGGGDPGGTVDDLRTIIGCAGLHLAGAAAAAGDARTTLALLDHSAAAAAEMGQEHYVLGQYFGPQHVAASRSICLTALQRFEESLEAGRSVRGQVLIPLVWATLLRTMGEASDRLERGAAGDVLREQADSVSPPLREQLGLGREQG